MRKLPRRGQSTVNEYFKKPGMTNLLKAKYDVLGATIFKDQESYKLNTFVNANALLVMGEEESTLAIGDSVQLLELRN